MLLQQTTSFSCRSRVHTGTLNANPQVTERRNRPIYAMPPWSCVSGLENVQLRASIWNYRGRALCEGWFNVNSSWMQLWRSKGRYWWVEAVVSKWLTVSLFTGAVNMHSSRHSLRTNVLRKSWNDRSNILSPSIQPEVTDTSLADKSRKIDKQWIWTCAANEMQTDCSFDDVKIWFW